MLPHRVPQTPSAQHTKQQQQYCRDAKPVTQRYLGCNHTKLKLDRKLVFFQGDIDGFRATQMIQVKAQPAGKTQSTRCARGAGSGMPFSRAATPDCIIWVAPFGRAVKQSLAALHLLTRTGPKLAPRAARVLWVLPARCVLRSTASRLAEPVNITLKEH